MSATRAPKSLSKVPAAKRTDARVTWADGMKPSAFPHTHGRVFMSSGTQTHVIWDGDARPQVVFTGALVIA